MTKLSKYESTFCKEMWTEQTGGNVMVDYIEMNDGTIIGITDECICTYKNLNQIDTGECEGVIFIGEKSPTTLPSDIHKEILASCKDAQDLCDKAIEQLIGETTVWRYHTIWKHMSEIIDKLK